MCVCALLPFFLLFSPLSFSAHLLDICVFALRCHKFQLVGAVFRGWAEGVDVSSYGENDGEGRSIMTGSRSGLGSRRSSFQQSKVNKLHLKTRFVGWTFQHCASDFLFGPVNHPPTHRRRRRRTKGKENERETKEWHALDLFLVPLPELCVYGVKSSDE